MKLRSIIRKAPKLFLAGALMIVLFNGCNTLAQFAPPPRLPDPTLPADQQKREAEDPIAAQQKRDMLKKRNEQRQLEIKKDTDQLLELATELKQYVDKTNENIISLEVIKKAEQIEKLAHAVKEKMKGQ